MKKVEETQKCKLKYVSCKWDLMRVMKNFSLRLNPQRGIKLSDDQR